MRRWQRDWDGWAVRCALKGREREREIRIEIFESEMESMKRGKRSW